MEISLFSPSFSLPFTTNFTQAQTPRAAGTIPVSGQGLQHSEAVVNSPEIEMFTADPARIRNIAGLLWQTMWAEADDCNSTALLYYFLTFELWFVK